MTQPLLSPIQARIVGVLAEKQRTVPDTYPLSLAALTAGCNQKTARDPVMSLSEADVLAALDDLRSASWVFETSGSRVMRYEQNVLRVLQIPSNSLPLLAVLMLRGPQTPAELRANVDRWHHFADTSSVEAYLEELANRAAGALVARLARAPGSREHRWTHLLCGMPAQAVADPVGDRSAAPTRDNGEPHGPVDREFAVGQAPGGHDEVSRRIAELEQRIAMLEYELTDRIDALERAVAASARPADD